jgi:hypothetical protein
VAVIIKKSDKLSKKEKIFNYTKTSLFSIKQTKPNFTENKLLISYAAFKLIYSFIDYFLKPLINKEPFLKFSF